MGCGQSSAVLPVSETHSIIYDPRNDSWLNYFDTETVSESEDEETGKQNIETKASLSDGAAKDVLETKDRKLKVYTIKDMNYKLLRIGRKVYSSDLLEKRLKVRFNKMGYSYKYDIMRPYKDLNHELYACQIGIYVEMPQLIRKRLLNDVKFMMWDMPVEECPELWAQLSRCMQQISKPAIEVKPGTDPNSVPFPLPAKIQEDPLVLRNWKPRFKWDNSFTDCLSRTPAWPINDGIHPHSVFVKLVASSRRRYLNTSLEGSAWRQLGPKLLDTTEEQKHWWIRKLMAGGGGRCRRIHSSVAELRNAFEDNLKAGWEAFQALCRKDWIPPRGPFNRRKPTKPVDENVL